MTSILQLNKFNSNKKGVSEVIAYVLLISITIALSVIVYNWLRFYVSEDKIPECGDGTNLIVKDFDCYGGDNLTITLQNRGRFTVDGFILRVHNRTGADFGFYILNDTEFEINPGEELLTVADLTNFPNLTYMEIQPFIIDSENGNEKISCKSDSDQEIICV